LLDHRLVPELNREDVQRRMERARIYEEIAQPRSTLLKERLIMETSDSAINPARSSRIRALIDASILVFPLPSFVSYKAIEHQIMRLQVIHGGLMLFTVT
jgi:hypothetical protein